MNSFDYRQWQNNIARLLLSSTGWFYWQKSNYHKSQYNLGYAGFPLSSQGWEESSQIMFGRSFGRICGRRFRRRFREDFNFFRLWAKWWITYQLKTYVLFIKTFFLSEIIIFPFRDFFLKHCRTWIFCLFFCLLDRADLYIIVKLMQCNLRIAYHFLFIIKFFL